MIDLEGDRIGRMKLEVSALKRELMEVHAGVWNLRERIKELRDGTTRAAQNPRISVREKQRSQGYAEALERVTCLMNDFGLHNK